jgi:hypothetical protein
VFERTRLGASLNYFLRCLKAPDSVRKRAESLFRPALSEYAKKIGRNRITADQACVAMITETLATCKLETLIAMRDTDHDLLVCMKALFQLCEAVWRKEPDKFDSFFHVPPEKHYYVLMAAS